MITVKNIVVALTATILSCAGARAQRSTENLVLNVVSDGNGASTITLNPSRTAFVIIDMWNSHWCMTASERVGAMVPRMNAAIAAARKAGMTVVWNPSDVVTAYSGFPQYERAVAVAARKTPSLREVPSAQFTAPGGGCMCGPGIRCGGNYGWDAMHPDLSLNDGDLISASTDEIYTLLSDRGITDIIYAGVHTNMCVYGKPGGLSEMWAAGFNCHLARDLNDAITIYDPERGYTPDSGTTETDENLRAAGIANIDVYEEFRRLCMIDADAPVDYVRFAPWGKPDRPYFVEDFTTVTLTAPHLDGTEIRYTLDGSEPTAQSPLYVAPLRIDGTTTVNATAFRKGRKASLPSSARYVKLPARPAKPDVYLDDLNYIPNAYIRRVTDFMWLPRKWKSFEGKPLRVAGKTYARGMGFRAPSSVQYELKPEYKRFVALAGIDENMLFDNLNGRSIAIYSSVVFKLFIDGTLVAESPVMRISQEPWRFDVEIPSGSRHINIVCADAGSRNILDYGNWVDAGFIQ